jgi:hypothetical protein
MVDHSRHRKAGKPKQDLRSAIAFCQGDHSRLCYVGLGESRNVMRLTGSIKQKEFEAVQRPVRFNHAQPMRRI